MFTGIKRALKQHERKATAADLSEKLRKAVLSDDLDGVQAMVREHGDDYHVVNGQEKITVNQKTKLGPTALILAARTGRLKMVQALLDAPAINLNLVDEFLHESKANNDLHHQTAIMAALTGRHEAVAEVLARQHKLAVNAVCASGKTVFACAVFYMPKLIPLLLQDRKGIDVNRRDNDGRTAIHLAVMRRNVLDSRVPDYIHQLLEIAELNLEEKDNAGATPYMLACDRGDKVMMSLLSEAVIERKAKQHTH